jgi:hypothetical protein
MIPIQDDAFAIVTLPAASVNNGSVVCDVIDTQGYDYCTILTILGNMDVALTAFNIQESDVKASSTSLTSPDTVPGSDYSVSPATLPTNTSGKNSLYANYINMSGRKRYLLPVITVGDGTIGAFVTVVAILSLGKIAASTNTLKNLAQSLFS